jgi:hypothetical protein
MTATILARDVKQGHSIPGLDNAYVVDVNHIHDWHVSCNECGADIEADDDDTIWYHTENMSAFCDGDESNDVSRQADPEPYKVEIDFHGPNGEEGMLTIWSDNAVTVDRAEPDWIG